MSDDSTKELKLLKDFESEIPFSSDYFSIEVDYQGDIYYSEGADPLELWDDFEVNGVHAKPDWGKVTFKQRVTPPDCFSWISGPPVSGLFLSEKAKSVFQNFNLGTHKFFPFTVEHKGSKLPYYFLLLLNNEVENVDYKKSIFYKVEDDELLPSVSLTAVDSFKDYLKKIESFDFLAIKPLKMEMKEDFDNTLEFFRFEPFERTVFISKMLKKVILDKGLTGFEILKTKRL